MVAEARRGAKTETGGLVYLDSALWKTLASPASDRELHAAWLALQCGQIGAVRAGVLALGSEIDGALEPAAIWPANATASELLAEAAEMAVGKRRGIVLRGKATEGGGETAVAVAYPTILDDRIRGVLSVELGPIGDAELQIALRQMQWGSAWVETYVRRRDSVETSRTVDRLSLALDLVAETIERERFRGAATSLVTELATGLEAERAAVGFVSGKRVHLVALSHSSGFSKRMNLVRALEAAMQESIDQGAMIRLPEPPDGEPAVTLRHSALLKSPDGGSGGVLTAPILDRGKIVGALTVEFQEPEAANDGAAEQVEATAVLAGPILNRVREEERWLIWKALASARTGLVAIFGPRHLGLKLACIATVAILAFFATYETDYRVTADAVVEGEVERTVAAPLDGYVVDELARPGDRVKANDILARLDDRDLRMELHAWHSRRAQHEKEYAAAGAARDRSKLQILRAQIDETDTQIKLINAKLDRTELTSPFDGIVLSGDLSKSLGVAVHKGDVLFRIAPLDRYRVALFVDERDIGDIAPGMSGKLVLSAFPEVPFTVDVKRITPVTKAAEGQNSFRVEGRLTGDSTRLRPGMAGVAKVVAGERLLISIWTRRVLHWARLQWFRWSP
jgi:RND family efflux transporter MFP subunit